MSLPRAFQPLVILQGEGRSSVPSWWPAVIGFLTLRAYVKRRPTCSQGLSSKVRRHVGQMSFEMGSRESDEGPRDLCGALES